MHESLCYTPETLQINSTEVKNKNKTYIYMYICTHLKVYSRNS